MTRCASSLRFVGLLATASLVAALTSAKAEAPHAFPPLGSAKSVTGELISADFIHRAGQFRDAAGKLTRFTLPPFGSLTYQGAEADLRDVPLGARLEFLLLPDAEGRLTRLVATKHGQAADEAQRRKFVAFTQARGLAGRIDKTEGKTITLTFFAAVPEQFAANWGDAFDAGKDVRVCVANEELRTWNAATVGERGVVEALESIPVAGYGHSGRRATIRVAHQLEGFRPGRIVRVFGAGWAVKNQPFQECLINYGYNHRPAPDFGENWALHYPEQFPFRTDFGNRHLPWFQATSGSEPPRYSEHVVHGALVEVDAAAGSGKFLQEDTGERMPFTLLDTGARRPAIWFRSNGAESPTGSLAELVPGLRYRFHLYQDAQGAFTRCAYLADDFSQLGRNSLNYQVRSVDARAGRLEVVWQRLPVNNYYKEPETPPPYGHSLLQVAADARIWNGDQPATLADLRPGDLLKVNSTAELPGSPSRCAEIWFNLPQKAKRGK